MRVGVAQARPAGEVIETRSEHMAASHHGRDQIDYVRMGAKRDGTITAIHVRDHRRPRRLPHAAHAVHPVASRAFVMSGCYAIPNVQTDITGVFTNKMSTDAIRGAGRPEATHMIEVMLDQFADELGHGPARGPAQELHPEGGLPGRGRGRHRLRLRRLPGALDKLLEHFDLDGFRREQAERASAGIYRGVGFSTYMEICGLAPSRVVGPRASASRPASGSRPSSACTRRAR